MDIANLLSEPLGYAFIQRGMLALILVGSINAVVGCFVVVRGMAFFGDALSHAVLPGIAISYTASGGHVGSNLFVGGLGAGIISALVIAWLTRNQELKEDSAIAIVFVTMFALGIAIVSTQGSYTADLTHILFGSINGISENDLLLMATMAAVVAVIIVLLYKEFLVISFDLSLAHSLRLPVEILRLTLLILIAVTIVFSLQAVGIALDVGAADYAGRHSALVGQAPASYDRHCLFDRHRQRCCRLLRLVLSRHPLRRLHRADTEHLLRRSFSAQVGNLALAGTRMMRVSS